MLLGSTLRRQELSKGNNCRQSTAHSVEFFVKGHQFSMHDNLPCCTIDNASQSLRYVRAELERGLSHPWATKKYRVYIDVKSHKDSFCMSQRLREMRHVLLFRERKDGHGWTTTTTKQNRNLGDDLEKLRHLLQPLKPLLIFHFYHLF
jgi:hypothetical protein